MRSHGHCGLPLPACGDRVGVCFPRRALALHRIRDTNIMLLQQIEASPQAGQHAEPEHIDLEQVEIVEIVLVPFDDGAVIHGGILDRHDFVKTGAGDDEAADMLRKVTRESHQRLRERDHLLQPRIGGIKAGAARLLPGDAVHRPAPERAGERADYILGKTEHLADIADGAAAAIADHGCGKAGMIPAIVPIDELDHLLAPLVLEIDIDIRRLAPLRRNEALEQKIDAFGINLRDAEAVADNGIRRRAAPLAQDALTARILDNLMHGEEIRRVFELCGDRKLMIERATDVFPHAIGIAPVRAFLGKCR